MVLVRNGDDRPVVHRLVMALPGGGWITKGDSMLCPDPVPADLSTLEGRVEAIIRENRLIRVSTGPRSLRGRLYAILSRNNLTSGALRLKARNAFMSLFGAHEPGPDNGERRFLVAILGGRSPESKDMLRNVDWDKVLEIASREGVAGIVYRRIRGREIPLPTLSVFEGLYRSIAARNLIHLDALGRLEHALEQEDMEVMTLKGASLLDHVYPGLGMRPMGDMDLMVRPGERERFAGLLYSLGYRRDPVLSHLFKREGVTIDLHIHALNTDRIAGRAALLPSGMEPIWENSVPWKEGFCRLRRPCDEDNLLLLSQHLMKHSFSSLLWLMDIYELLKTRDGAFWKSFSQRADHLMQKRCFSYPLYLLYRLFGHAPPQGAGFVSPPAMLSRLERGILEAVARGHAMDRMGVFLALFCIPGVTNRVAFLQETLFPKPSVVKKEFLGSPGAKRASFYGRRLREVAGVLCRQCLTLLAGLIRRFP